MPFPTLTTTITDTRSSAEQQAGNLVTIVEQWQCLRHGTESASLAVVTVDSGKAVFTMVEQ